MKFCLLFAASVIVHLLVSGQVTHTAQNPESLNGHSRKKPGKISNGRNSYSLSIKIDGAKKMQQMNGVGVNANTRSWQGDELKPAIDFLLDSMHAKIWRVIAETVEKWEDENDNADPFDFNWQYYNALYETPKFQKVWEMMAYLNSKGITDKLMINFMGPVPKWMGEEKVLPKYEDEYIEMLASFFYYARNTKHLQFGLISLMNEPDIRKEGPTVGSKQYVLLLHKLIERLEKLGINDIKYVAPDVAGLDNGVNDYVPEIMKDTMIMNNLAHIGLHTYGGYYANIDSVLKHSAYPKTDYWVTEWNNWCAGCDDGKLGEYDYKFGSKSVRYLFELIKHGASACLVWEAYDSYYEHHAPSPFSYWGVLAYNKETKTYIPRKHYYVIAQVAEGIKEGAWQVDVTGETDSLKILAFHDPNTGEINIVGLNTGSNSIVLNCDLQNLPSVKKWSMTFTNSLVNKQRASVLTKKNTIQVKILPNSVFLLNNEGAN